MKKKELIPKTLNSSPWIFFVLALGISWFFWIWIIVLEWNVWKFPAIILGAFGLFGPAIAEILLIAHSRDNHQWKDYWHRVIDFKRIGKKWYIVIFLTFPILNSIAIILSVLISSSSPDFELIKNLLNAPWKIIPFVIFILLFGPLPEELGWRGYALDGLQSRFNALTSSLILGIIWALWHIPLFFMKGTFQHDHLGIFTYNFWLFMIGTIITSILFTWIYNNTNRSTLSAILFHFMINFSGEIFSLNKQARLFSLILVTILSLIVIFTFGSKTLTRKQK